MVNISFLYGFILCLVFAIANFLKLGLRGKTYVLPSTLFALMWGLTSLGGFLYSNLLVGNTDYYNNAGYLKDIGSYQLSMLIVVFIAFLLARYHHRNDVVRVATSFGSEDIVAIRRKMRWILYLFFLIGMYRLISVVSKTGFDYSAMRTYYVNNRYSFNTFELNVVRIGSYLNQFAVFYICILGMETALRSIRLMKLVKDFLLFIPFQMSFGGRLFILAFFAPFIFSYLLTYSVIAIKNKKKIDRKFLLILASPVIMLVLVQIVKMGETVSVNTFTSYLTEIFYTSTCYIHMNELWSILPQNYSLGYGVNCLGFGSPVYNDVIEIWGIEHNSASVCVPSIIPQAFLDFGKIGSLVFFFIIFYLIEDRALVCLKRLTTKNMMFVILLCIITYQTPSSSCFDCLRAFIVGYIALILFVQMTQLKTVKPTEIY
ncbi:MAG: oligosaccharide repeat unit polymerase [Bacteroidales bacterium]|nr:oligosaccharide repeat unit polymerase [Bacteroidales bacterium]